MGNRAREVIPLVVLVLYVSSTVRGSDVKDGNSSVGGYGFEVLSAKLEYIQYKLVQMDLTVKEDREAINQNLAQQKALFEGLLWTVGQLGQTLGHNLTGLQGQVGKILSQQTACASHELMRKEIDLLTPQKGDGSALKGQFPFAAPERQMLPFRSCKEEPSKRSGKYLIRPDGDDHEPFLAYCEQSRFGGGWLVILLRFDGTLDFRRNWAEYRDGFGSIDREFWLGLERIHRLTSARPHELMVELEDFSGAYVHARYKEFEVASETEHYKLTKASGYTGTAGDSLNYHMGMKFTTFDRDNDGNSGANCAATYEGAWWHNSCHYSHLTGRYIKGEDAKSMNWYHYKTGHHGMAYARMMVREV